jgi:hypothetical protein
MSAAQAGDEIWVAARQADSNGIDYYYESGVLDASGTGVIVVTEGVAMYGGFNGTETSRSQRNFKTNVTKMLLQMSVPMRADTDGQGNPLNTVVDGFTFINSADVVFPIGGAGNSNGTCKYLSISNNTFRNGGFSAGAIYVAGSPFTCSATIQGNTFYSGSKPITIPRGAPQILSNFFTEQGGTLKEGIFVGQAGSSNDSTGAVIANNVLWGMQITVYNSGVLVANNTVVGGGGAQNMSSIIGIGTSGGITVVNNIIAFNGNGLVALNAITEHNNLAFGSGSFDFLVSDGQGNFITTPGTNDIESDPLLTDRANGDLHLTANSPAIDHGDNSVVKGGWLDFDGNARIFPQAGTVDIGAYEYGSGVQSPPPTKKRRGQTVAP